MSTDPCEELFTVITVNLSPEKGTAKAPVERVLLDRGGVVGDGHHGTGGREVSLLDRTLVEEMAASAGNEGIPEGAMGENLTCRFHGWAPRVGDLLSLGDAVLRVEAIGKECRGYGCAIFRRVGRCVMPSDGVFCSVLAGGEVRPGMEAHAIRGSETGSS